MKVGGKAPRLWQKKMILGQTLPGFYRGGAVLSDNNLTLIIQMVTNGGEKRKGRVGHLPLFFERIAFETRSFTPPPSPGGHFDFSSHFLWSITKKSKNSHFSSLKNFPWKPVSHSRVKKSVDPGGGAPLNNFMTLTLHQKKNRITVGFHSHQVCCLDFGSELLELWILDLSNFRGKSWRQGKEIKKCMWLRRYLEECNCFMKIKNDANRKQILASIMNMTWSTKNMCG